MFTETFSDTNFYKVFPFLDGHVDIKASTAFGKNYAENMYANLLMRVKLYLDAKKAGSIVGRNSREELFKFIPTMRLDEA